MNNDKSLKNTLYQNITYEGVSIDFLYRIIEEEKMKRATGEKKLRDLSAEGKIEPRRRRANREEYWETYHNPLSNEVIIGYRKKKVEIKPEKSVSWPIQSRLFKPSRIYN